MDRRTALKLAGSIGAGFAAIGSGVKSLGDEPAEKKYYSPCNGKAWGAALNATCETRYDAETVFESPNIRYVRFPIEFTVTVYYERAEEAWTCFNMTNEDMRKFSMEAFLQSEFIPGKGDMGGSLHFLNNKFQLASILLKD